MAQPKKRKRRETFGAIRRLPSGRFQASYVGLDKVRHVAPMTFSTQTDACAWLAKKRTEMGDGDWAAPRRFAAVMFRDYARDHIQTRTNSRGALLKPRTADEYMRLLVGPLSPFGARTLGAITPDVVRRWFADQVKTGKRTQAAP